MSFDPRNSTSAPRPGLEALGPDAAIRGLIVRVGELERKVHLLEERQADPNGPTVRVRVEVVTPDEL